MAQDKQIQAAIERLETIEKKLNVLVGGQLVGVLEETEWKEFSPIDERIARIEILVDNLTDTLRAILAAQEVLKDKVDKTGQMLDQLLKLVTPKKD